MKYYFKLHFTLLYRKMKAFGIPPALGFFIGVVLFFYLSNEIFENIKYGAYIILLLQTSFQQKLSNAKKLSFLKAHFSSSQFLKIRLLENMMIAVFFIGILLYKFAFLEVLLSVILSIILCFIPTKKVSALVIPTPFKSKAYEFNLVFRKRWFVILISYLLMGISFKVGNFNLGIFSALLIGIFGVIAHLNLEPPFYVWVYNLTPKAFISKKIKNTLLNVLFISIPNIIMLLLIDFSKFEFIILGIIYVIVIISAIIVLKYSKYPNKINAADLFLCAISAIVVPFFLILIPIWYKKSLIQLKPYLNDNH